MISLTKYDKCEILWQVRKIMTSVKTLQVWQKLKCDRCDKCYKCGKSDKPDKCSKVDNMTIVTILQVWWTWKVWKMWQKWQKTKSVKNVTRASKFEHCEKNYKCDEACKVLQDVPSVIVWQLWQNATSVLKYGKIW